MSKNFPTLVSRFQSNPRPAEKSIFHLPHDVAFEPYLKAFQYKVLNSILFTNKKLCKIGYTQDDKCSLCKTDSESLYHIFFERRHTKQFWKEFQYYYYTLTREFICLTLQDVITGILYTNCPLLNYLILIAKLYLWGCRRNQTLPVITAFSSKVKLSMLKQKSYIYSQLSLRRTPLAPALNVRLREVSVL